MIYLRVRLHCISFNAAQGLGRDSFPDTGSPSCLWKFRKFRNGEKCYGNFLGKFPEKVEIIEFLKGKKFKNFREESQMQPQASQAQNMWCMRQLVYIENSLGKSPIVKKKTFVSSLYLKCVTYLSLVMILKPFWHCLLKLFETLAPPIRLKL